MDILVGIGVLLILAGIVAAIVVNMQRRVSEAEAALATEKDKNLKLAATLLEERAKTNGVINFYRDQIQKLESSLSQRASPDELRDDLNKLWAVSPNGGGSEGGGKLP